MSVRITGVALVAMLLPATASSQAFEYTPGTAQYRISQVTKGSQEAMGQKQDFESSSNQLLTVTVARPSKDTLAVSVVVDSISAMTPMGPAQGIERLIGVKADAKLSPAGILYTTATKDSTIEGAINVADGTGRFLPRIRGRLVKGAAWTDTSVGKLREGALDINRRTVSKYTVEGDTTINGERTWKVARRDSTTISGTGTVQGQALTMEGASTGGGTLLVSPKGAFMGAQGGEEAKIRLVLSANGMEVNITQSATTKVEKVK